MAVCSSKLGLAAVRTALSCAALSCAALSCAARPVRAQDEPVGPCSPYRAADGDVPSEMPGCARHRRPTPGSLADELRFRQEHDGAEGAASDDDEPEPRRRPR